MDEGINIVNSETQGDKREKFLHQFSYLTFDVSRLKKIKLVMGGLVTFYQEKVSANLSVQGK